MNSSLWSADLTTHAKIVAVSLIAAIFVVTIGISARISDADTTGIRTNVDAPWWLKPASRWFLRPTTRPQLVERASSEGSRSSRGGVNRKDRAMGERMTTELFGLSLTALFVCLLVLNALSF